MDQESVLWRSQSQSQVQQEVSTKTNIVVLSGNNHPSLAQAIARHLGIPLCNATVSKFLNGETNVTIRDSVR